MALPSIRAVPSPSLSAIAPIEGVHGSCATLACPNAHPHSIFPRYAAPSTLLGRAVAIATLVLLRTPSVITLTIPTIPVPRALAREKTGCARGCSFGTLISTTLTRRLWILKLHFLYTVKPRYNSSAGQQLPTDKINITVYDVSFVMTANRSRIYR
ncbi:uncharacterized protein K452DRAFT_139516 [Aplosporella prunicola CBS 121167]|uniref:Uncharacterized protein n=1 Tax=Aplosporella prunicola CBS 121167 TaxID=1176127 RepID=A0A6A6AYI1_9PEZI|nr:uncharacterized protein K452DRAFT_139516 [Aplosporella prunicola CBS 121167]KAF2136243.1 hypothetical protein K452DRAFT_139516 [Aplosporella prunicola CBS 121167]